MESTQRIIREVRAMGWSVTPTGGGHLACTHPDTKQKVYIAASPSSQRWKRHVEKLFRHALANANNRRSIP